MTPRGQHESKSNPTNHARVRAWKSLRVLDMLCNVLLGRPSSTTHMHEKPAGSDCGREHNEVAHRVLALCANFDLCSIIEVISGTLTKSDAALNETAVEKYLEELQSWTRALPEELRQSRRKDSPEGVSEWKHREKTIANVHVACSYYFTVILLTQPFLVATTIPKVERFHGRVSTPASRMKSPHVGTEPVNQMINGSHKFQELSQTCIGAARILIQMCHDAADRGILLDNMCILQ